jgi:hypothetical protein
MHSYLSVCIGSSALTPRSVSTMKMYHQIYMWYPIESHILYYRYYEYIQYGDLLAKNKIVH